MFCVIYATRSFTLGQEDQNAFSMKLGSCKEWYFTAYCCLSSADLLVFPFTNTSIMKYLSALCTLAFALSFAACDEISMPYEKTTVINVDTTKVLKKVFLEEYTGQSCRNCPDAHRQVASLHGVYGDRLISMSIHAGGFAEPDPPKYPNDFRTVAGTTLASSFAISNYPSGTINRKKIDGDVVRSKGAWSADVANATNDTAYIKLDLTPVYTASTGEVAITVKTTALKSFTTSKPLNVALFIVEDSIVAPQLDGSTLIPAYTHRDMLRDAPLGAFGAEMTSNTTLAANTVITNTYKTSISGKPWSSGHLKVIAIVCEKDPAYEVWQVEEAHIVK